MVIPVSAAQALMCELGHLTKARFEKGSVHGGSSSQHVSGSRPGDCQGMFRDRGLYEAGGGGECAGSPEVVSGRRPFCGEFQDSAAGGVLGFKKAAAPPGGFFFSRGCPKGWAP